MWVRLLKGYLYRNIGIVFVKEKEYTHMWQQHDEIST